MKRVIYVCAIVLAMAAGISASAGSARASQVQFNTDTYPDNLVFLPYVQQAPTMSPYLDYKSYNARIIRNLAELYRPAVAVTPADIVAPDITSTPAVTPTDDSPTGGAAPTTPVTPVTPATVSVVPLPSAVPTSLIGLILASLIAHRRRPVR